MTNSTAQKLTISDYAKSAVIHIVDFLFLNLSHKGSDHT